MAFHNCCFVSINFVIDGLGEELKFRCISQDTETILYLKKILFGEVRLRKYCSEIFKVNFDTKTDHSNLNNWDVRNENNSDKVYVISYTNDKKVLHLLSYDSSDKFCTIGVSVEQIQLFKKIICPRSYYKVTDIYCTFRYLGVNDKNEVVNVTPDDHFLLF